MSPSSLHPHGHKEKKETAVREKMDEIETFLSDSYKRFRLSLRFQSHLWVSSSRLSTQRLLLFPARARRRRTVPRVETKEKDVDNKTLGWFPFQQHSSFTILLLDNIRLFLF